VQSAQSAEDAAALVAMLPDGANALAIVRVGDILQSPRSQQEGWSKAADEKFMAGAGGIPSWVKCLTVGYQIRLAVPDRLWAAGVASVPENMTIQDVAQRENMPVESLSGVPAVHGRRNAYILQIGPGLIGLWKPAVRQEAARWADTLARRRSGMANPYLAQAATAPGDLVLAMDLSNTFDPVNVRAHLDMNRELDSVAGARDQLQSLLLSLRGATFSAMIKDQSTAQVRFDFDQEVGTLGLYLKSFFIDAVQQMGTAIDDFDHSDVRAEGKSLILTAGLSDESLRRIMSLIVSSPDMAKMKAAPAPTPGSTPSVGGADVTASQRYYRAVNRTIDDLQKASRRTNDYARTATWHENFAMRINDLPEQGVDPDLIAYGNSVGMKLRALARSLRGQSVEVNAAQGTLTYDATYTPGWASVNVWGGIGYGEPAYNYKSNLQQVREKQAAAVTSGTKQRDDLWGMIVEERTAIQRTLRDRYGADFVR
jgi:hypothetical protein